MALARQAIGPPKRCSAANAAMGDRSRLIDMGSNLLANANARR
jgi:hypothetical protein